MDKFKYRLNVTCNNNKQLQKQKSLKQMPKLNPRQILLELKEKLNLLLKLPKLENQKLMNWNKEKYRKDWLR